MNNHNQMGARSASKAAPNLAARFCAVLLSTSVLAGLPAAAMAQEAPAAPAPVAQPVAQPAPAPVSNTIRTISIVGAQRLEPQTILSYIRLRVGQTYTSAAADGALKDLGATELFSNFSIRNDAGNVVILSLIHI